MVKVFKKGKTTRGEPLRHMPPLVLMQRTVSEHVLRLLDAIYQCRIQYRTYILDIFFVATRESFQWLTFAQLNSVLLPLLLLLKIISFVTATFAVVVIIAFNYLLLVIHYYQYGFTMVAMIIVTAKANNDGNYIQRSFVVVLQGVCYFIFGFLGGHWCVCVSVCV